MGAIGSVIGGVAGIGSAAIGAKANAKAQAKNIAFAQGMYDDGKQLIQPEITGGNAAENARNGLLGIGSATDAATGQAGFTNYRDTSGYNFIMNQGTTALNNNAAARGAFQSGATAKALVGYGQNLADTTEKDYLSQLNTVAAQGLGAKGSLINQGQQLTDSVTKANNSQAESTSSAATSAASSLNKMIDNLNAKPNTTGSSFT